MDIAGARVLVIGGVHRLGRAIAGDLAKRGAGLCITSRSAGPPAGERLAELLAAGAGAAVLATGDVRAPEGARALVAEGAAALGGLDAVVYAASGAFRPQRPERVSEGEWDASLDTIAKGFFFAAGAAHDEIVRRRGPAGQSGVIVAITDSMGIMPWPNFAAHGAAKAAQIHLVKTLASAWAADHVRVCGVAPGPVDLPDDEHPEASQRAALKLSRGRLVDAADIGAAVRFCLETEAVTGANVVVDNGALVLS
jgi:NAD(P)-dependent dehydrogenase (short-subunit alcohol dehydrogenase family)